MIIAILAMIIFALMAIAGLVDVNKLNMATEVSKRKKQVDGICVVCDESIDGFAMNPAEVACYPCRVKESERKIEVYKKTGKYPW